MSTSRRTTLKAPSVAGTIVDSEARFSTHSSKRYTDTVDAIPDPDTSGRNFKRFQPIILHPLIAFSTPVVLLCMGIALEVLRAVSEQRNGFPIPTVKLITPISPQFLASILPTIFVIPVAIVWRELDWTIRWFKPYLVLLRGNASAEESLLLDYIERGPFFSVFYALKYKHRVVFWSSLTALVSYFLQPLTSSIMQIRTMPQTSTIETSNLERIGLVDDVDQLNAFLAAAGYVEAASLHGLGDPPFVNTNWATTKFAFPEDQGLDRWLTVNTTAIRSMHNCANPAGESVPLVSNNSIASFSSVSVEGCRPSKFVNFNPTVATQQYGVVDVECPNDLQPRIDFRPVMFWFFLNRSDGTSRIKTVFCSPTIESFSVTATVHVEDSSLASCLLRKSTDQPISGNAFNAVVFDPSPDPFILARGDAIASGLSGAIFRAASRQPDGLEATFDLPNGMLDLTSKFYTQHLSISARSIYFLPANDTLNGELTSQVPRLWVDPLPAHILSIILFAIGLIGVLLQAVHRHQYNKLKMTTPPGNMAAIISKTAHSGFGQLLHPYDDLETIEKKLDGLKFRFDQRTNAIVADDSLSESVVPGMGSRDEAMLSLLGQFNRNVMQQHSHSLSSSQIAFESAIGYPPWVHGNKATYKTPYDSNI